MPRSRPNFHRKAAAGPKVKWNIKVPVELAAIIENHFWSSTHGKPIYGKRNELIVSKLWEYVRENNLMSAQNVQSNPSLPTQG